MKSDVTLKGYISTLKQEIAKLTRKLGMAEQLLAADDEAPASKSGKKVAKRAAPKRERGGYIKAILPYLAEHGETHIGLLSKAIKAKQENVYQALLVEVKKAEPRVERGPTPASFQLTAAGAKAVIDARNADKAAPEPQPESVAQEVA